ncbi:hypothetical protein QTO31_16895 [Chloroflexus sp. MS-CIW-1]|nr:hypothetical protein [Chloroflexus sp. MS-CIW-1]MDN5273645.1 hypothetical protein [Chloroflexus sp. MS-CIW-1]
MINLVVFIESFPCPLATSSIRGINKIDDILAVSKLHHHLQSIIVTKVNPARNMTEMNNSLRKGLRIPSRANSFPILAMLDKARAFGEDSAV